MPVRITMLHAAREVARRLQVEIAREIRSARISGAVSQRAAGRRVGMSHAQFGRVERGDLAEVSIDQLSRACQAVGLRLIARAVPDADPALDAGQLALLARLEAIVPRSVPIRREVPLPVAGDRRAWDAVLALDPEATAIEAEARLRDIQALDRRCALKLRDGAISRLILLVSDTVHNRAVLAQHRDALRSTFPMDTREVLLAVRAGRTPAANGIVVL